MPELDLDELIAAAREDLKSRSKHSFKKSEKAKVAQRMLEGGEVHERLKEVFKRQPGGLMRLEVEYHNLSVETDGKVRRMLLGPLGSIVVCLLAVRLVIFGCCHSPLSLACRWGRREMRRSRARSGTW